MDTKIDFTEHNNEVREVWKAYNEGNPVRIPMILGINPRVWLLDNKLNTDKITFEKYSTDPDTMIDIQLKNEYYIRHNIYADHEMGMPENGFHAYVDYQNYFEAGWYGAKIIYPPGNSPTNEILLNDDNKNILFEKGFPDPFGNSYVKALEMYEYMQSRINKKEYKGCPLTGVGLPAFYTDGPMTNACNIRGATEFCIDIYEDPEYAERLLDYITDATIMRIKAWNKRYGNREIGDSFGFADDSVQLLSSDMYRDLILPRHKRLIKELSTGKYRNSIHLCGDATRHFKMIRDELNVYSFDTGYPVKHGELVRELGEDVQIYGGVHVGALLHGNKDTVIKETKRIMDEVKPYTKKFIMREANNLSPCTPLENLKAMYETVKTFGKY